jgi:hypothetical protein
MEADALRFVRLVEPLSAVRSRRGLARGGRILKRPPGAWVPCTVGREHIPSMGLTQPTSPSPISLTFFFRKSPFSMLY